MEEETHNGIRSIEKTSMRRKRGTNGPSKPMKRKVVRRKSGVNPVRLIIFAIVIIVIAVILVSTVFQKGTINIALAKVNTKIDGVFTSSREPSRSGDLTYLVRGPYSKELSAEISNVSREPKYTKAQGTITVYNTNTSGEDLQLVNRTRFLSSDNKLYRLTKRETIPGGKTLGGKFTPGSKEVKIEADETGDTFNLSNSGERFSIPGLAKYKEFSTSYATSETPVIGGFGGVRLIPDEDEEEKARERLRNDIRDDLKTTLRQALVDDSRTDRVVFDELIFIEFEPQEDEQKENTVIVKEKGVLRAVSFRESELASILATSAAGSPTGVSPERLEVKGLTIVMQESEDFDVEKSKEFSFRLSGDTTIYWGVDDVLLIDDIGGKKKNDVRDTILESYPQITEVKELKIFPIWKSTFPTKRSKVDIKKETEN